MTARNDFLEAYIARRNCPREYAEGLLRHVEVQYAEAERIEREKKIEELREPGCPGQDPAEREGENFSLTRQITRLSAFAELANEAVSVVTASRDKAWEERDKAVAERDRAWKALDDQDGQQVAEESVVRKRLRTENEELCRALERNSVSVSTLKEICAHLVRPALMVRSSPVPALVEEGRYEEALTELQAETNPRIGHVLKPAPESADYVQWSGVCDMPAGVWTRSEALAAGIPSSWLARADALGTSWPSGNGGWDDDVFIPDQRGILRREHLGTYSRLFLSGRQDDAYALLEPLDGETAQDDTTRTGDAPCLEEM